MSRLSSALLIGLTLITLGAHAADRSGPKIYISVDMEGVAGVVTSDRQSTPARPKSLSATRMATAKISLSRRFRMTCASCAPGRGTG